MTKPPDGGMYGIKLIDPPHLLYREFTEVRDGSDGRYPLMNFGDNRKRQAADIPIGQQCLVYVTKKEPQWGRFIWAIEFIGMLEDGDRALVAWGHPPGRALKGIQPKWSLHRPIRFLACVDPSEEGPKPHEIAGRSGYRFRPYGGGHYYLSAYDYHRAFDAINWTWRAP